MNTKLTDSKVKISFITPNILKYYVLIIVLVQIQIFSEYLSGNVGGKVLTFENSPYFINYELEIPKNEVLKIEEGCVLYFKKFTGIKVEGSLIVEGTSQNPVIFTSINEYKAKTTEDDTVQPSAFDWNGILIESSMESVKLSNFILKNSVYGLKSNIKSISFTNGFFSNNGQYSFTIKDKIIDIPKDKFCSYKLYKLAYHANGADGGKIPALKKEGYRFGFIAPVSFNRGGLSKSGCTFKGWNTQQNGEGINFDEGSTIKMVSDITLFALWDCKNSKILNKKLKISKNTLNRTKKVKILRKVIFSSILSGSLATMFGMIYKTNEAYDNYIENKDQNSPFHQANWNKVDTYMTRRDLSIGVTAGVGVVSACFILPIFNLKSEDSIFKKAKKK